MLRLFLTRGVCLVWLTLGFSTALEVFISVPDLSVGEKEPFPYGTVHMEPSLSLFESDTGIDYGESLYPRTFEELQQYSGFMYYQTTLPSQFSGQGKLITEEAHGHTIVYLDMAVAGVLSRSENEYSLDFKGKGEQQLVLLVENQGYINFQSFTDIKGLTKNVTLNGEILTQWKQIGYRLYELPKITIPSPKVSVRLPAFYLGTFVLPKAQNQGLPQDTFVDMTGWGKGILWINGLNLGRYWSSNSTQVTLYLPGSLLRPQNQLTILELETEPKALVVKLVSRPVYSAKSTVSEVNFKRND